MSDIPEVNNSDRRPASTSTSDSGSNKSNTNRGDERTEEAPSKETNSQFAPTELIERPEATIEVYNSEYYQRGIPSYSGRGEETAAARGYNAERLASTVFGGGPLSTRYSPFEPYIDTYASGSHDVGVNIESKICVNRYPSGSYGQFRFWQQHHNNFLEEAESNTTSGFIYVYFFLVYEITDEETREVGKLVTPANQIDEILDRWSSRNHKTMGQAYSRDMSWNLLLKRLGVPMQIFRELPIVDLTDGLPSKSSDN
jgi:hypothetical protein